MSNATLNLTKIIADVGTEIGELTKIEAAAAEKLEKINTGIKALQQQKAKLGKSRRTCTMSQACYDAMLATGVAAATATNMLSLVRTCVNEGKLLSSLRTDQFGAKGKGKGKGKASGTSSLADLLVKVFNHDSGKSFETLCDEIEASFNDAKIDTLYAGFKDYLKAQGFEIND